jgi:hypothetical protein
MIIFSKGSEMKKNIFVFCVVVIFAVSFVPCSWAAKVQVVKLKNGWQLLKDGEPFFVKGICYSGLNEIGKSQNEGTMRDWMIVDDDHDGRIDLAYQTWMDKNHNNKRDKDEPLVGDFKLIKDMGANTLRLYHHSSGDPQVQAINRGYLLHNNPPNKEILRQIHKETGLMVMMGDLLGAYTVGSGADWMTGTDYRDPVQRANMMRSVEDMIKEFKDEPYILVWALGNENNLESFTHTNAVRYPVDYAKFVNAVAKYIKKLDPNHPVCLVNGETMLLDTYKEYAPNVDIIGFNSYRHWQGFNTLWKEAAAKYGKPVLITEYGTMHPPVDPKTKILNEERQALVHKECWEDIAAHRAGGKEPANALGGFVFEWVDSWWQSGNPWQHDVTADEWNFEWHGLTSQGDGRSSPLLRQPREVYYMYKDLWQE